MKSAHADMPYILLATEQRQMFKIGNKVFRIRRPNIEATTQLNQADLQSAYTRVSELA